MVFGLFCVLKSEEFGEFHPANVSVNTSTQFSLSHRYSTYTAVHRDVYITMIKIAFQLLELSVAISGTLVFVMKVSVND